MYATNPAPSTFVDVYLKDCFFTSCARPFLVQRNDSGAIVPIAQGTSKPQLTLLSHQASCRLRIGGNVACRPEVSAHLAWRQRSGSRVKGK